MHQIAYKCITARPKSSTINSRGEGIVSVFESVNPEAVRAPAPAPTSAACAAKSVRVPSPRPLRRASRPNRAQAQEVELFLAGVVARSTPALTGASQGHLQLPEDIQAPSCGSGDGQGSQGIMPYPGTGVRFSSMTKRVESNRCALDEDVG